MGQDVGFRSASEHHANWSGFVDKIARYVDWCIQYALMVRMSRGKMSDVADWVNGKREELNDRMRENERNRWGAREGLFEEKTRHAKGLAAMGNKVQAAKEFISLGGEFAKKAREMGIIDAMQKMGVGIAQIAQPLVFVRQMPLQENSYSLAA